MKKILSGLVLGVFGFLLFVSGIAEAEMPSVSGHSMDHRSVGSPLEVHINRGGGVLVRGARVTAVSGANITATNMFGGYAMVWTIITNTDTHFVRKHGGASGMSEISVDDYISFSGIFDMTATTPTVNARVVKNWSVQNLDQVLTGTVKTVNTSTGSFVLTTGRKGDVSVQTNAGTEIMNGTTTATFSSITVGARAKVRGIWNSVTNILNATAVRLLHTGE